MTFLLVSTAGIVKCDPKLPDDAPFPPPPPRPKNIIFDDEEKSKVRTQCEERNNEHNLPCSRISCPPGVEIQKELRAVVHILSFRKCMGVCCKIMTKETARGGECGLFDLWTP